jgi:UDP-N-acetyl-2-amino-2-deoxyglucuronate dehydrogenase
VLCSPNGLHAEQAICLQAGAHVVVQKHLTLDIATSGRVVEEADRRDLLLSVVSQRRFEPPALAVKQASTAVSSYYDEIGWRGSVDLDGGALMNQGIHAVDLMRWLFGEVTTVQGQVATRVRVIQAEDTAVACMRFALGGFGVIGATHRHDAGLPAEINLFFEHGSVSLADDRIVRWAVPGVDHPSLRTARNGPSLTNKPIHPWQGTLKQQPPPSRAYPATHRRHGDLEQPIRRQPPSEASPLTAELRAGVV